MTVRMHWLLAIPGSLVTVCFLAVLVFSRAFFDTGNSIAKWKDFVYHRREG